MTTARQANRREAHAALRRGARIERGSFSGYYLCEPGKATRRLSPATFRALDTDGVLELIPAESKVGETWKLADERPANL